MDRRVLQQVPGAGKEQKEDRRKRTAILGDNNRDVIAMSLSQCLQAKCQSYNNCFLSYIVSFFFFFVFTQLNGA